MSTRVLRASWEGDPPVAGDYLLPMSKRSRCAYRILHVKAAKSLTHPFRLRVEKIRIDQIPADGRVHSWEWDSAKRQHLRDPLLP